MGCQSAAQPLGRSDAWLLLARCPPARAAVSPSHQGGEAEEGSDRGDADDRREEGDPVMEQEDRRRRQMGSEARRDTATAGSVDRAKAKQARGTACACGSGARPKRGLTCCTSHKRKTRAPSRRSCRSSGGKRRGQEKRTARVCRRIHAWAAGHPPQPARTARHSTRSAAAAHTDLVAQVDARGLAARAQLGGEALGVGLGGGRVHALGPLVPVVPVRREGWEEGWAEAGRAGGCCCFRRRRQDRARVGHRRSNAA